MTGRAIRYQGAVVRDDHLLLIQHCEHAGGRSYWLLPGGGIEAGETPQECVEREVREETHLHVQVLHLLREDPDIPGGVYERLHTYLCRVLAGEAQPGYEPEIEAAQEYAIVAVQWCDLRRPDTWDSEVRSDSFTCALMQRIQASLGYPDVEPSNRATSSEGPAPSPPA